MSEIRGFIHILLSSFLLLSCSTQEAKSDKLISVEKVFAPDKGKFFEAEVEGLKILLPKDIQIVPGQKNIFKRFTGELMVTVNSYSLSGLNSFKFEDLVQKSRAKFRAISLDTSYQIKSENTIVSNNLIQGEVYGIPGERYSAVRTFVKGDSTRVLIISGLLKQKNEKEINTILSNFH